MNIIVIMTDDQRWDTLWAMPTVNEKLVSRGVNFVEAVVSIPICCPSRASFLSGGMYAHNTGVLTNSLPYGGATMFNDTNSLAVQMQNAGYKTGFFGKYLNGYNNIAPYIPPGWTQFITKYRGNWTDYSTIQGSSTSSHASQGVYAMETQQYITDYLTNKALQFIDGVGSEPFFIMLSTSAPHSPATPDDQDAHLFSDYVYRDRAYEERDPEKTAEQDEFHRNQLRSLQSVDRNVGKIVDYIEATGKLEKTFIVYTSDNGYHWGEHGLIHKGSPYRESIRVPLVVFCPNVVPREDHKVIASNLDIPATCLGIAGVGDYTGDGKGILHALVDRTVRIRPEGCFIEAFKQGGIPQSWAGWYTQAFSYVKYFDGTEHLYHTDKYVDPYEMNNIINDESYVLVANRMRRRVDALTVNINTDGPDEDDE